MKKIFHSQLAYTNFSVFLLRLIFGGLFVYHGYMKLISYDTIAPHFPDLIGIGSKISFILVIFAELVCGFFVAIGFLTRLAVVPIFITMIVAYFIAHGRDTFDKKELAFMFLLLSVVIFVLGSGKFSLDRLIFKK